MLRRTFLGILGLSWLLPKAAKAEPSSKYSYVVYNNSVKPYLIECDKSGLEMFRPTVSQDACLRRLASGEWSEAGVCGPNRSGRSMALAVWFASYALNKPVTMRNGEKLQMRPAGIADRNILCVATGRDWLHTSRCMQRILMEPGAYQIANVNGGWVALDPENPSHDNLWGASHASPPLIDARNIIPKSIRWENRKDNQIRSVDLDSGSSVVFIPSTSTPMFRPVSATWIDEGLDNDITYQEIVVRSIDLRGRVAWSCSPDVRSRNFRDLHDRAGGQSGGFFTKKMSGGRGSMFFRFKSKSNPHVLRTLPKNGMDIFGYKL